MDKLKKLYQKPTVSQVNLVPEEAVLEVCKNHEFAEAGPGGGAYCEWPAHGLNPAPPCHGVTGS